MAELGERNLAQVSILNGCEFIDFDYKLLTNFDAYFGSVAVQNDSEGSSVPAQFPSS